MDIELRNEIKNQPITIGRLNAIYDYLCCEIEKKRSLLERFIEQGKDTASIEYDIAHIEYVAGLRDTMPRPYWKLSKTN